MKKSTSETKGEIITRVIAKAWTDPRYLEKLKSNPQALLEKEGMKFKKGTSVSVLIDTDKHRHFVIPTSPGEIDFSREQILKLAAERLQVVTQRA